MLDLTTNLFLSFVTYFKIYLMATCVTYGCPDYEEHLLNDCEATVSGGGDQAIFFRCDAATVVADDYDNATLVNQDIADGLAVLVQNVKLGIPAPSQVAQGASYVAGKQPKPVAKDYVGTFMDENVNPTTDTFFESIDAINGSVTEAILIKLVDDDSFGELVDRTSGGIHLQGGKVVPDDNTDSVHYEYTFNYRTS